MQTRREYAASLGLAIAGARGRLSREANAAIEDAINSGIKFSDVTVTRNVADASITITKKVVDEYPDYLFPSDFRYPESEYIAREMANVKVTHSMRECCNTCKVSLTNHGCNTPSVYGRMVTIERKVNV